MCGNAPTPFVFLTRMADMLSRLAARFSRWLTTAHACYAQEVDLRTAPPRRIGAYVLAECVGVGGHARVYRATTPDGLEVAVKLLGSGGAQDPGAIRRFEREIEVVAALRHPGLIRLIDHGVDSEHGPYMVTSFVHGPTVREVGRGHRLCPEAALVLLQALAGPLSALHGAGIIHRDIKPENIILDRFGALTLIDLGLALAVDHSRITEEGVVAGSLPYMSPEQIEGHPLSPASDMWSVGILAYEWICGERPFARERPGEEVAAILAGRHVPLIDADRRVSAELSELVESCLEQDPANRPKDASELLRRVAALFDWTTPDEVQKECAWLLCGADDYAGRIAPYRVADLTARATAKIEQGDSFAALAILDRALAYSPTDTRVLSLVDQATGANTGKSTTWLARGGWSKKRIVAVAAAGLITLIVPPVIVFGWTAFGDVPRGAADSDVSSSAPMVATSDSTTPIPADSKPAPSAPKAARPIVGLVPLDPLLLSNDGPRQGLGSMAGDTKLPSSGKANGEKEREEAIARARAAASAAPSDPTAALKLAAALLAAGKSEEADGKIEELITKHPNFAEGWYMAGYTDLRRGEPERAEERISRAIALEPNYADALRVRGIIRHRMGRVRDAYGDLSRSLELEPDAPGTLAELAHLYANAGRGKEALPLLRRLVDVAPTNADVWIDLAQVLDDTEEAVRAARKAIELKPRSARAHRVLCRRLVEFEKPEAMTICNKAIALDENDPEAYMLRGILKARIKQDKSALIDMDKAVSLDPSSPNLRFNRHLVRGRTGDMKGAAEDLRFACRAGHQQACEALDELNKQ